MNDVEKGILGILKQFEGESSYFLLTSGSGPCASLGDEGALQSAVQSLADQGLVTNNGDVVTLTDAGAAQA